MTKEEITFAQEQIKLAKHLQSLSPEDEIDERCSMAGCDEKIRKVHWKQFVKDRWNPHPSERFVRWWVNRGIAETEAATTHAWNGIDPVRAYNCESVREVYRAFLADQGGEMHNDRYEPLSQWDETP